MCEKINQVQSNHRNRTNNNGFSNNERLFWTFSIVILADLRCVTWRPSLSKAAFTSIFD